MELKYVYLFINQSSYKLFLVKILNFIFYHEDWGYCRILNCRNKKKINFNNYFFKIFIFLKSEIQFKYFQFWSIQIKRILQDCKWHVYFNICTPMQRLITSLEIHFQIFANVIIKHNFYKYFLLDVPTLLYATFKCCIRKNRIISLCCINISAV